MEIIDYKFKEIDNREIINKIGAKAKSADIEIKLWEENGQVFCQIDPGNIVKFCRLLNEDRELGFEYIRAITGVDYEDHMEVVYSLYSFVSNWSINIKARLDAEKPEIETITSIYKGADWFEREIWEMFGINIKGHPDLRPLLLVGDEDFHPLKKSFEIKWEERQYKPPKFFE